MSGITVKPERPSNAWRGRGYTDGFAKRDARPPSGEEDAAAYRDGYRRGAEARSKVGA